MICDYEYVCSSPEASLVSPRNHMFYYKRLDQQVMLNKKINVYVEYLNLGFSKNLDEETVIIGYKKHIAYFPRRKLV